MNRNVHDSEANMAARHPTLFWVLLTATAGLALMALLSQGHVVATVAAAAAVATLVLAFVQRLRHFRRVAQGHKRGAGARRSAMPAQDAIIALLSHDADVAYLTDIDGDIIYANQVALERFGDISDGHLASAFSRILANPEAVLFRLQNRAAATGAAREDIITRSGQFRMSLVHLGDDKQLWRLDDLGKAARAGSSWSGTYGAAPRLSTSKGASAPFASPCHAGDRGIKVS